MGRISPRGGVVVPLDGVRHGRPRFVGYTRDSGSLCSANYVSGVGTGWADPLECLGHPLQLCMISTKVGQTLPHLRVWRGAWNRVKW
jgi:hypothetical protein